MNEAEDFSLVWTCSPAHLRKFAKLGYEMVRNDGEGRLYKVRKMAISFRRPVKTIVNLNPEQRKAAADRMRALTAKTIVKP